VNRLRPLAALLCLAPAACTSLFHSNAPAEQTYYLRPPASAPAAATPLAAARIPISLRVGHPLADPGLETPHIILVQADHRLNFYSGSRWAAPLADVVDALAVQTLRASGDWSSVEDSTSPFPSNYLLQIAVRRFEADYTAGGAAPTVYVVLDCILGRREGRDVVASFSAAGSALATANRLGEVVAAFEQATGTALAALSQQAQEAARGAAQHPAAGAAQNEDSPVPSSSRASQ
jgi:cholesterol transport system auxiliary component